MQSIEILEIQDLVYVAKHIGVPGVYKIGKTRTLKNRLSCMNSSSPYGMEILHTEYSSVPQVIESAILEKWRSHRINGEWFELNDSEFETMKSDLKAISEIVSNCNHHFVGSQEALIKNGFSVYSQGNYRYKPKSDIEIKWKRR